MSAPQGAEPTRHPPCPVSDPRPSRTEAHPADPSGLAGRPLGARGRPAVAAVSSVTGGRGDVWMLGCGDKPGWGGTATTLPAGPQ